MHTVRHRMYDDVATKAYNTCVCKSPVKSALVYSTHCKKIEPHMQNYIRPPSTHTHICCSVNCHCSFPHSPNPFFSSHICSYIGLEMILTCARFEQPSPRIISCVNCAGFRFIHFAGFRFIHFAWFCFIHFAGALFALWSWSDTRAVSQRGKRGTGWHQGAQAWCHPKWHGVQFRKKYAHGTDKKNMHIAQLHSHKAAKLRINFRWGTFSVLQRSLLLQATHLFLTCVYKRRTKEREQQRCELRTTGKALVFWKLKQKKSMRLNIGSECHLVGEEVAQGGASTSFSPLCSEGGLQIQIKAHTNTVQRKYQLTQIHIHTDHTNTQIHKYTNTQEVL